MLITEHIRDFVCKETLVFWAGNIGHDGYCDMFRSAGLVIHEDRQHITIYLTDKYAAHIIHNLEHGKQLSFLVASILSFESYQFKGLYLSSCQASQEDEKQISVYTEKILPTLKDLGLNHLFIYPFINGSKTAITLSLLEIFEQTPKPGTGNAISI